MTIAEYRAELKKLLDENRKALIIDGPMSIERAIRIMHANRKEGMILEEMNEVGEMTVAYDLAHRFAELLKALDAVGA